MTAEERLAQHVHTVMAAHPGDPSDQAKALHEIAKREPDLVLLMLNEEDVERRLVDYILSQWPGGLTPR